MNNPTPTYSVRKAEGNTYEVVARFDYPITLNAYTTKAKAEAVADKLRALDL